MEYVYARIKSTGFYLGKQCPAEGFYITREVLNILKLSGIDIEEYDPRAELEARKAEAKKILAKKEEPVKVTDAVKVEVTETKKEEIVPDIVIEEKESDAEKELDKLLAKEVKTLTKEAEEEVKKIEDSQKEEEISEEDLAIDEELKDGYHSTLDNIRKINTVSYDDLDEDALSLEASANAKVEYEDMSRQELCEVLRTYGHVEVRDPLAPKARDNKEKLLNKIYQILQEKKEQD